MVAICFLLTCALAPAQPAGNAEWLLLPNLSRGQELVYRGTFVEEVQGRGVQFTRSYRLENRIFITETSAQGAEAAFFTLYQFLPNRFENRETVEPVSARLHWGRIDPQGKVLSSDAGVSLAVPLEGPPLVECGAFIEVPRKRVSVQESWLVAEADRPARSWRVIGTEVIQGAQCVRLEGLQQSADWERPRADRKAWQRRDLIWMAPRLGLAYRVERTIEQREPGQGQPNHRAVIRYELERSPVYPRQLYEDYRREMIQAQTFARDAEPYLREPGKYRPQLDAILTKIGLYLDNRPATPYREAVLQVQRSIDGARRGVLPPAAVPNPVPAALVVQVDQPAPDFVVTDLTRQQTTRLHRYLGQPVLLIFFTPTSVTLDEVFRFGQSLCDTYRSEITVLGLAMSDETDRVLKQCRDRQVTFPILAGKGLSLTYAVDATPKFVLVDPAGIVRATYTGWGRETPTGIRDYLHHWLGQKERKTEPATGSSNR